MAFRLSVGELRLTNGKSLAKHLREDFGMKDAVPGLGKEKLLEMALSAYRARGIKLAGLDEPAPSAPAHQQAPAGKPGMTAGDASRALAGQRLAATGLSKADIEQYGINADDVTGPGYVHPYYRDWPALEQDKQYRVAILVQPRENAGPYASVQHNGRPFLIRRDMEVAIPREVLDLLDDAIMNIDVKPVEGEPRRGGDMVEMRPQASEYVQVLGDVITDHKGNILEWVYDRRRGRVIEGRRYEPEADQAHA
jgi:hypothetical protein